MPTQIFFSCITFLVSTFYHTATFIKNNIFSDHHVSEVRHEKGRRLWFDLSKVDENMQIILAELRLYQLNQKNEYKKSNESMSLAVYSIMNIDG